MLNLDQQAVRPRPAPLIMHVLFRFATGGLENGVVNLVNHMSPERFRHAIVALDTVDPVFAARVCRPGVSCYALHKPPGQGVRVYPRFLSLLRELRPDVVHTRNLAALEMQVPAAWARVPARVHGEHGWDAANPGGRDRKQRLIRRLYAPFVHRYITVSRELQSYLTATVGIDPGRVDALCNGVDTVRFRPATAGADRIVGCPFDPARHWIVGTVGRLQAVKHQTLLLRAFALALAQAPDMAAEARLAIVGDGPLRHEIEATAAALGDRVWLAGDRGDVPEVMRGLHAFVLPSLAEGISNTILEAMATGLPVLATAVGGNAELLDTGRTGWLLPSDDAPALATALVRLWRDRAAAAACGTRARAEAQQRFSLQAMVDGYAGVYEKALRART